MKNNHFSNYISDLAKSIVPKTLQVLSTRRALVHKKRLKLPIAFIIQFAIGSILIAAGNPAKCIQLNLIQYTKVHTEEVHITPKQVEINTHRGEDYSQ